MISFPYFVVSIPYQIYIVNKEGMSRLPKRQQQAKRVAPPAVPEIFRHSGSSFGSAGYGSCDDTTNMVGGQNFYAGNDSNAPLNVSLRSNASNTSIDLPDSVGRNILQSIPASNIGGKEIEWLDIDEKCSLKLVFLLFFISIFSFRSRIHSATGICVGGASSSSGSQPQSQQTFIYHVQNQQPLTHKAAVYYHQQLALQEDQGSSRSIIFLLIFFFSQVDDQLIKLNCILLWF